MALAPGAVGSDVFNYQIGGPTATRRIGGTPSPLYPYSGVPPGGVPGASELEQFSSADIAQLLNPPDLFPDTSRRAAETAAGRGIGGSAAGYGTALRMTDEERIRRMALGEQMLSGAYARNLPFNITPYQREQLNLQRDILNAQIAAGYWSRGRGGGEGGTPYGPAGGMPGLTTRESPDFVDLTGGGVSPADILRTQQGPYPTTPGPGVPAPTYPDMGIPDWLGGQEGGEAGGMFGGIPTDLTGAYGGAGVGAAAGGGEDYFGMVMGGGGEDLYDWTGYGEGAGVPPAPSGFEDLQYWYMGE